MRPERSKVDEDVWPAPAPQTDPATEADPWHGIPAELLDGASPYDTDTAGGCG